MPATFYVNRGDEFEFDLTITKAGPGFPITKGVRVHFFMKHSTNDDDPAAIRKSTIDGGIFVMDAPAGKVRISLKPEDTLALPNQTRTYSFEVKVKEPDGSVFTVLDGEMRVKASVPNRAF